MGMIGNQPANNFLSVTKDTFDGNASSYTLSKAATTNGVAVYVENVRQIPTTAYSVSGTTLTFTGTTPAGTNNVYVLHHNSPASTATHPAAQDLTAVNGTMTGALTVTGTSTLTGATTVGGTSNLTINNGDIIFGTANKGICLGATSATAANTLHDYEEGTYTFAVTLEGSGTISVSGSYDTGSYVKIGQLVTCGGDLRMTGQSSPNGEVRVSLPFVAINNTKRLFVGVVNTVGIATQSDQRGGYRLRPAANVAKATIIWNSSSSFFGVQGQNISISNNDAFVHSLSYLVEE